MKRLTVAVLLVIPIWPIWIAGCQQKMSTQGRLRPDTPMPFFPEGTSARRQVPGTVARGDALPGEPVPERNPLPVTRPLLERGRERFEIYCMPCHGMAGQGDGPIVQRGLLAPPTFHQERLRTTPDRHFFEVITRGYGAMYSYADRLKPEDRWAVTAYIRALQLSQHIAAGELPAEDRAKLGEAPEAK